MKLSVNFIYQAWIIKPRCRKPVPVAIRDSVDVTINETTIAALPIAFKIGDVSLRWDGQRLWNFNYYRTSGQDSIKVLASEVLNNTITNGKHCGFSCADAKAPFHNFWHQFQNYHKPIEDKMSSWLADDEVKTKQQTQFRDWVKDNRSVVLERAKNIAKNLLVVDGLMYASAIEPRYTVMTFGLGNNHGGTGMFVQYGSRQDERYFTSLEYKKACKTANAIAKNRGDNKSMPVEPNGGHKIEVLITGAVKLKTFKEN